jgi:hypothetical protein
VLNILSTIFLWNILMIIYFRACEKQDTISYVTRFNNFNKTIILKKCWLSIQKSITKNDIVIVIEDGLSEDTLAWLNSNSNTILEIIKVPEHSWEYHQHTVTLIETLKKYSTLHPDELHYIVEDDYLHTPDALTVLRESLENWYGFAVPYDYPDRYINPKPCQVVIGKDRHWRTIDSSTMTVLAKGKTWLTVLDALLLAAPTSNDKIFEKIYEKIACINPLPGVANHLTDRHSTPLVDWVTLWDSINVE